MDMPYKPPPPTPATILPDLSDIVMDPTPSAQGARTNILAGSTMAVRIKNAQLKDGYLNVTWANYVKEMQSGETLPPERQVPPKPPMAWQLAPPDANGYVFPMISDIPICDVPPTPVYAAGITKQNTTSGVFDLGGPIPGNPGWFYCGPRDSEPAGFTKTIPGPQDKPITVQKWVWPFGAKYEQIA